MFDGAIGIALQTYASERAHEVQQRREEYLAFVAHDLRTPLLAIALAGRFLEQTLPQRGYGADTARMLRTLRRSHQQLDELVRKVMEENANLQSDTGVRLQRREFDLWPFVEAVIEELHPVANAASTRLVNDVPDDLMVFADASALKRVLQNLITNAINILRAERSVSGPVNRVQAMASIAGSATTAPGSLTRLANVFDKGETDSLDDGGKGLGLAIVQAFAEAHGGNVAVESKIGQGFSRSGFRCRRARTRPSRLVGFWPGGDHSARSLAIPIPANGPFGETRRSARSTSAVVTPIRLSHAPCAKLDRGFDA